MRRTLLIIYIMLTAIGSISAQTTEWKRTHMGNRAFAQGQYAAAAEHYRSILSNDTTNARAHFNMGDAYLGQQNIEEAMKSFDAALKYEQSPLVKGMIHYNRGYVCQKMAGAVDEQKKQELLRTAIEEYKAALRISPYDSDARYNLALCQHQLKNSQQPQNQSQQQQKQEEQQDDQNKQQQQQSQEQKQQQQPQQNPQTQQYYNMMRQNEKRTLERVKQQRVRGVRGGKNW